MNPSDTEETVLPRKDPKAPCVRWQTRSESRTNFETDYIEPTTIQVGENQHFPKVMGNFDRIERT